MLEWNPLNETCRQAADGSTLTTHRPPPRHFGGNNVSLYLAEIHYRCGHVRTRFVRSAGLAGARYRDLNCYPCRIKASKTIKPEDVPTAFIARSDFQPGGVPVKIISVQLPY